MHHQRRASGDAEVGRAESVRQKLGQQISLDRVALCAGTPHDDAALADLLRLVDHLASAASRADRVGAGHLAVGVDHAADHRDRKHVGKTTGRVGRRQRDRLGA